MIINYFNFKIKKKDTICNVAIIKKYLLQIEYDLKKIKPSFDKKPSQYVVYVLPNLGRLTYQK